MKFDLQRISNEDSAGPVKDELTAIHRRDE